MNGNDVVKTALKYEGSKGLKFCKSYGYTRTVDWCVIFIWYIFKELCISKKLCNGSKVNNVGVLNDWLKVNCKKVTIKNAKAGDIVIQNWDGYEQAHAGIVVKSITANSIKTVEGNAGYEGCNNTTVKQAVRYSGNIYAIYRPNYETTNVEPKPEPKPVTQDLTSIVKDVLVGKYGNGSTRKKKLGKDYEKVQNELNRLLKLVTDTMVGKYGNGATRKKKLGKDYDFVQWYINYMYKRS